MPTKTVRCSSNNPTFCKCGLGPERLSGCGTAVVETAPSSTSRAFEPQAGRGLAPTLEWSLVQVSFRRATQTYKGVG